MAVREVAFELECFEWADERLEVAGRWKGLAGRRLARPVLSVDTDSGRRKRLVAMPGGHFGSADDWRATFAWPGDPAEITGAELEVGGNVVVELPLPDRRRRRRRRPPPDSGDETLRAEVGALRGKVERLRAELAGRERENMQLRAQLDEEPDAVAGAPTVEIERLASEREELTAEIDRLAGRHDRNRAELSAELARAASERDRAAGERDRAAGERDRARTELEQVREERDRALAEVDELREAFAEAAAEAEASRDHHEAELAALEQELDDERAALARLTAALPAPATESARRAAAAPPRPLHGIRSGRRRGAAVSQPEPLAEPEPTADEAQPIESAAAAAPPTEPLAVPGLEPGDAAPTLSEAASLPGALDPPGPLRAAARPASQPGVEDAPPGAAPLHALRTRLEAIFSARNGNATASEDAETADEPSALPGPIRSASAARARAGATVAARRSPAELWGLRILAAALVAVLLLAFVLILTSIA